MARLGHSSFYLSSFALVVAVPRFVADVFLDQPAVQGSGDGASAGAGRRCRPRSSHSSSFDGCAAAHSMSEPYDSAAFRIPIVLARCQAREPRPSLRIPRRTFHAKRCGTLPNCRVCLAGSLRRRDTSGVGARRESR
jgi:hypothetical protein